MGRLFVSINLPLCIWCLWETLTTCIINLFFSCKHIVTCTGFHKLSLFWWWWSSILLTVITQNWPETLGTENPTITGKGVLSDFVEIFSNLRLWLQKEAHIFLITPGEFYSWKMCYLEHVNEKVIGYGNHKLVSLHSKVLCSCNIYIISSYIQVFWPI